MRSLLVPLALLLAASCAAPADPEPPRVESLRDLREAAEAAEATWGVPADLLLAVAYVETRLSMPEGDAHGAELAGIAAIRPWLSPDPIANAAEVLGVDQATIEHDPIAGLLAAAVVLDELADARLGRARPEEIGAWSEVIADYAALDLDDARASYVGQVLDVLRRGVRAPAADGSIVEIAPREVLVPETVAGRRAYGGAEYPDAIWTPASTANYTAGRGGAAVRYVVIHTTQGSYAGAISWFRNPSASVSAHFVIRSSDGEVTQMLSERDTGWHAGNWSYNQQSVGIEHEGFVADPGRWYTDAMYESSARLTRYLCDKYGIPTDRDHIIGHVEVPGASHTDPGSGWDWPRYMDLVRGVPRGPDYAAEYVGQEVPAEMIAGERAVAWVELRNSGGSTWDLDGTRLGTTGPRDHDSPFFDAENWLGPNRASPPDHSDYGPGDVGRFSFMITAPAVDEPTLVRDTFGLVQEGVTWFGPEDVTIEVMVRPRDDDGDGAGGRLDCDDADPARFTGATERCGDTIDQDCDGADLACDEPEIPPGPGPGDPEDPPTDPRTRRTAMVDGGCSATPGAPGSGWALLLVGLVLVAVRRRRG